jgi:hypothetical protein
VMPKVGSRSKTTKRTVDHRFPVSVSLNANEHDMLVLTSKLCRVNRSAVVRRGIRRVMQEAVVEAQQAGDEQREPDFAGLRERQREGDEG